MEKEVYYRYIYARKSIFSKIWEFVGRETKKRYGKEWAKEMSEWTTRMNNEISWLYEPEVEKGEKFYFKELGKERYERTLLKVHKEMLRHTKTPFRMNKNLLSLRKLKRIKKICFRKTINNQKFLYDLKSKRKIGKIIYEDKHQIGII